MSELPVHTEGDEVSAHARHTGHRWFDITLALCAIFISAVSLFVAVEHGHTQKDLVAASNWPFLRTELSNTFGEHRAIEIGVSNGGVGPAKIRSFELSVDGRPIDSPMHLLAVCCGLPSDPDAAHKLLPNGSVTMAIVDNTVLRPGESIAVLVVDREGSDPVLFEKLHKTLRSMTFNVCYCSTLDTCWTNDLRNIDAKQVSSCPVPAHPYRYDEYL